MLQIIFDAPLEQAAQLSDTLSEAGALAVTLQDAATEALYEPPLGTTPLWTDTQVVALFETRSDLDSALAELTGIWGEITHRIEVVDDKDWVRENLDSFHPLRFGSRLWVCPSWRVPPDPDAVNLMLDPGLAFGTGTHPTTALCLEWLADTDLHGWDVVDYGCGSGILAVAAAKLGARHVWAIDHDPQALQATRVNAEKNKVSERIGISSPDTELALHAHLLLANILARPLMELASYFSTIVKPAGHIVLSGILAEQAEDVSQAYRPWFELSPAAQRDGWVRLDGKRK